MGGQIWCRRLNPVKNRVFRIFIWDFRVNFVKNFHSPEIRNAWIRLITFLSKELDFGDMTSLILRGLIAVNLVEHIFKMIDPLSRLTGGQYLPNFGTKTKDPYGLRREFKLTKSKNLKLKKYFFKVFIFFKVYIISFFLLICVFLFIFVFSKTFL